MLSKKWHLKYNKNMRIPLLWRFVAVGALLTLVAIYFTILSLALVNPLAIALFIASFIFSLYGLWLIFTGTNKRLIYGWVQLLGSFAVMILAVIWIAKTNESRYLLRISTLVVAYVVLINVLRNKFWSLKRQTAIKERKKLNFKNPYLIINPKSGNGRAIKAGIPDKAKAMGIKVKVTKKSDNITDLATKAVKSGVDVLGVSGGDGTLGAVATVALKHNLPLIVLPGGTRCHFARDVGLDPKQIVDALNCFKGVEQKIDVGDINGRIFLNNASLGLYADVIDNKEYRDHKVATTRSTLQKLLAKQKFYPLKFKDKNGNQYNEAVQVLVGVNAYDTVNMFELGHRKNLTGKTLQITAITNLNDDLTKFLLKTAVLNKDFVQNNANSVKQWESSKFTVSAPTKKIVVGVDGEREEYSTPVTIIIKPGALRLMVLPEGIRSRPKNAFSAELIGKVWRAMLGQEI